jgi:hypothetical protein
LDAELDFLSGLIPAQERGNPQSSVNARSHTCGGDQISIDHYPFVHRDATEIFE